jgi:hypothetical protein
LKGITGPWNVSFDSKWGGPEHIEFTKLEDWSQRPERGIRYYSGKAIYHVTFDIPPAGTNAHCALQLGTVYNMASVRLNGRSLGVAWCPPWSLAVPPGVLREHGNELEITVANLWLNRLIGDTSLPENQRFTWTTRNPFEPHTPLSPSGLLGPVSLQTME